MLLENALAHYYDRIGLVLRRLAEDSVPALPDFSPGTELPALTSEVSRFFAVSDVSHVRLRDYRGKRLALLDLTGNPQTQTTKTFASLLIVARAVRYIQDTGKRITIVTPSSANKAVALRDAVLRAITLGLVTEDQLNIVVVVPVGSVPKIRSSDRPAIRDQRQMEMDWRAMEDAMISIRRLLGQGANDAGYAITRPYQTFQPETAALLKEIYVASAAISSLLKNELHSPGSMADSEWHLLEGHRLRIQETVTRLADTAEVAPPIW